MKALSELGVTQGPWKWDYEHGESGLEVHQVLCGSPGHSGDDLILTHTADWDINPANSRLLAAAPVLYEALWELYERCRKDSRTQEFFSEEVAAAKAALELASGELGKKAKG